VTSNLVAETSIYAAANIAGARILREELRAAVRNCLRCSLASVILLSTPLTAMAALRLFLGRLGLAQASNGAVKFMDLGANLFTVRLEI
jgi:hypothetical protein